MKKASFLFTILCMGAIMIACDKDDNKETKLTFSKNKVEIAVNASDTITVSGGTTPYTALEADTTIAKATVDSNKIAVKGLKKGNTTIKVTDKNGVNTSFPVTVTE
jgi:carbohydrate-selective porin OprB